MRVRIDPDRCQGHGLCAALHPDVFDLDANGFSVVQHDALDQRGALDPSLLTEVDEAIGTCPEDAIAVVEGSARPTVEGEAR